MSRFAACLAAICTFAISGAALAAPGTFADTAIGKVLVAENGMTLYTWDNDVDGASMCYDKCAEAWPPLFAAEDSVPEGDWTIVDRTDGTKIWAYKGKPVYFWMNDKAPGDTTGDMVGDTWHVVKEEAAE